jgi:hypothetical protein
MGKDYSKTLNNIINIERTMPKERARDKETASRETISKTKTYNNIIPIDEARTKGFKIILKSPLNNSTTPERAKRDPITTKRL